MGRPFNKRAICFHHPSATASQRLACSFPAGPWPWGCPAADPLPACHYQQPFDIPAGGPGTGVEAERGRRLCWEEEGRAPSASWMSPVVLVSSSFLPLPLPLWLYCWQYGRPLAQDAENSEVSQPTPEGCARPSLDRGSEQPWWLPVRGSSAPRKQARGSRVGSHSKHSSLSSFPLLLLLGYRTW